MLLDITESILKRDRTVITAGLIGIIAVSWAYIIYMAWTGIHIHLDFATPSLANWNLTNFSLIFVMWAVMQVAMMTPSAAPMILTFAKLDRQRHLKDKEFKNPFGSTGSFLLGYVVVWTGFSLLFSIFQWGLHAMALLSPAMVSTSSLLGGIILISAGTFQFTPLKQACLHHCRSPLGFLMAEWREGRWGPLIMGVKHGAYCVVCCWVLMALLFVAGVMNLLWMTVITAIVLVEKLLPAGDKVGLVSGFLLIVGGIWMIGVGL